MIWIHADATGITHLVTDASLTNQAARRFCNLAELLQALRPRWRALLPEHKTRPADAATDPNLPDRAKSNADAGLVDLEGAQL